MSLQWKVKNICLRVSTFKVTIHLGNHFHLITECGNIFEQVSPAAVEITNRTVS